MKKIVTGTLLGLLLSTGAMAGENRSGFYLGAGMGSVAYSDSDLSVDMGVGKLKNDDNGLKLYGGYQFNNVIGIELGYADYGKNVQEVNTQDYSYAVKSYSVAANVGYSFLDSQLRPFVNVGLGFISGTHENLPVGYININDNALSFHHGLGIQYEPNVLKGVGFRLAYEADMYFTSVTAGSTSKTYTQLNSMVYGAVQYKF